MRIGVARSSELAGNRTRRGQGGAGTVAHASQGAAIAGERAS